MLRGLRKASSNWLGKVIMAAVVGFLIISFGIWGIGDIFRGFGVSTVAKVGRSEISIDQFRIRYNEEMQQLGRQMGRPLTPDQAQAIGLEQQVLGQMVAAAALDERARQLRLGISNDEVAKQITADPAFRGFNGQFDMATYLQRLRDIGYTQQRFEFEQRQTTLRRQIAEAVGSGVVAPKAAAEALSQFRDEERSIDYIALDGSKAGDVPAPTPEQLAAYFEERKFAFRAPEYRKIELITVSQQEIANTIEVGEEEARRVYQDRLKLYETPERRHVVQISFANADDARRASERINGGLAFDDLAKEPEIADRVVDLGTVTKADMIDPTVANAAFDLAEGAVSGPVTGRFGTVILHVLKIEPASTKSFAEVESDLKRDIALDRAKDEVNKIRDKIDEELGGGTPLEEIGKKLNLKVRTIEAVDRSGRTPAGEPAPDLPAGVDVVNSAFNTEVGNENDALSLPGGGFVWYDVVNIMPSRERTLDEVKDRVEARFREDEIIKRLNAKTEDIVGKLKSGASLAEVAAAEGLTVESKSGLKRQGGGELPPRVISEVFRTAKDAVGSAEGQNPTNRVIFRVTDVKVPAFDANSVTTTRLMDQLKSSYSDDVLTQYVTRLESDIGTDINRNAIAQAVGRAPSESGF
ncbi:MAG TPA: SurA N-terminal domain-containing protein [Xanthobacteraceae bacterium]|jgi:peptidyl-prolyl cis-trans isomerase D|nr:SurA N-terminal domain-containing protein [Xanthobacteraceae bacterium]